MGLFTDKCLNAECDQRVRKGSKFCPRCGHPAPRGLTRCGRCGVEVRTSSRHCWHCGEDTATVAKPMVLADRWARSPGDFAVRIDDQDIRGWLAKPLVVEHGTRALLFQNGRCAGELDAGRYDLGGFLKGIKHLLVDTARSVARVEFLLDRATTVVLVDAGDSTIDLENANLWSADPHEIRTAERLVLRVKDPESLFVNIFKGRHCVTVDDLEYELAGEVQALLAGIVAQYRADELFANLAIRERIERQLREAMAVTLSRLGLELVQVRFIEFGGDAFENLRRQRGELAVAEGEAEITIQRTKLQQRLREVLTQDRMAAFGSEKDLEEFIRQTEHELGLKQVVRDDELARLKQRFQFERDREGVLRRLEIETLTDDAAREKAWKDLLADERAKDERHQHDLERRLETTKGELERKRIELEMKRLEQAEDLRQAEEGLRLQRQVKDLEHEAAVRRQQLEAATLEARSKATAEALLTIVDGEAASRIADLERLRRQERMTPEQILALAASASPEAARALAARYQSEGHLSAEVKAQLEQRLAEQRQMAEGHADRLQRVMQTSLQQMGQVATTRARPAGADQTIVVPGAAPVVVQPGGDAPARRCPHCGHAMEHTARFCPECGKQQHGR